MSGLTAIAGFGSLILGKHRGIQSLGYVMSTGLATCMIAGLTFLPALLNLFVRGRASGKPAADEGDPVPTMHDRHWVGRNRGKNLKCGDKLKTMALNVNPYLKGVVCAH